VTALSDIRKELKEAQANLEAYQGDLPALERRLQNREADVEQARSTHGGDLDALDQAQARADHARGLVRAQRAAIADVERQIESLEDRAAILERERRCQDVERDFREKLGMYEARAARVVAELDEVAEGLAREHSELVELRLEAERLGLSLPRVRLTRGLPDRALRPDQRVLLRGFLETVAVVRRRQRMTPDESPRAGMPFVDSAPSGMAARFQ